MVDSLRDLPPVELLRSHARWFLFEGIVLVLLGIAAIAMPVAASLAATVAFGWILLLAGAVGLYATWQTRRGPGFNWSLLSAVLAILIGVMLLWRPLAGALSITTLLIAFLLAEGCVTLFYALHHREAGSTRWRWMLVSGVIDLVLGVVLLTGMPGSGIWALGTLLGVNLLFGGVSLIALGSQVPRTD